MQFRIADSFTDSLARLTGEEQKAVKTTAFDLQMNPAQPGLSFHKLDKAKDKNFWSVRVSSDIRLIVHKTESSLLLCYVDHHDKAYQWAERRKVETHPTTGAAQLVEIRERIQEITIQRYVEAPEQPPTRLKVAEKHALFADRSDDELMRYGVPREWLVDVKAATEDSLLVIADHLPGEAADALLELAVGGTPRIPQAQVGTDPFGHPDAQRRFRVMANVEELERALAFPWDKWTIFLHPEQRDWVERDFNGPARISGSAGTGKTIVALHRAVELARRFPESRVLLATFNKPLANALAVKVRRLTGSTPHLGERISIHALSDITQRLFEMSAGPARLASKAQLQKSLGDAAAASDGGKFNAQFLLNEWEEVVDAWQLDSWESYRDVKRLGRKTRLSEAQRRTLWSIFERVRAKLAEEGLLTEASMLAQLTRSLTTRSAPPFDYAVIDESQDINVAQLRFLAALAGSRPNGLFFAGDLGQRIFQQPFSWKSVGVDIRGRSRTLHVNYRTSHQIRTQADRLLGPQVADVDGNAEARHHTVSTFNGPPPEVLIFDSSEQEEQAAGDWLAEQLKAGVAPHEIAVMVRSSNQVPRALAAIERTKVKAVVLDDRLQVQNGSISVCTMHLAKGLEFRSVAVLACDDEVIPLQARIESVTDDSDLEEIYDTERQLLYVACTRARDHLLITATAPASEFLDDLTAS